MFVFSSAQFSRSVMSDSLRPHETQHSRHPCPSLTPGVHSNWCPSSRWCHPAISSSVVPFSFCPQSLPGSQSFPMSQLFAWGGQSIGVSASASVLPMNTQDWSPLGGTGWVVGSSSSKSHSLVSDSCDPMDCSPPGFSVHGISPGKNTGVGCHFLLQGIFPIQESNPCLLHCRQILHRLS